MSLDMINLIVSYDAYQMDPSITKLDDEKQRLTSKVSDLQSKARQQGLERMLTKELLRRAQAGLPY